MSNTNSIESSGSSHQLQSTEMDRSGKMLFKLITAAFVFLRAHLFAISVIAILLFGWSHRTDNYLSAENGPGYILGIVGGSLMLLVLLYPLSKRTRFLTRLIPMRYWFGIHMLFGIIGPVMVLFHSNFNIGSTNSTIALVCMLLVAGSGLIGRYIYTHIHHGLYGKRISLGELQRETEDKYSELLHIYEMDEKLNNRRSAMEHKALQNYTGIMMSLVHVISLAIDSRLLQSRIRKLLKSRNTSSATPTEMHKNKIIMEFVERYTMALRRIVAFRVYERLFSLWHVLHLPLFFMMIITAIIHIFAVHMY